MYMYIPVLLRQGRWTSRRPIPPPLFHAYQGTSFVLRRLRPCIPKACAARFETLRTLAKQMKMMSTPGSGELTTTLSLRSALTLWSAHRACARSKVRWYTCPHRLTDRTSAAQRAVRLRLRKIAWYRNSRRPSSWNMVQYPTLAGCHRWSLKLELDASPPRGTVHLRIVLGYDTYIQQTVRGIVSCRCPGRGRGHRESQRLALLFPRSRLVMATSTLTPPTFSVQRS